MSRKKPQKRREGGRQAAASGSEPARAAKGGASRRAQWGMIALVVFLLLIFTVTGPMITVLQSVLTSVVAGLGPPPMATVELPSGREEISGEEYTRASRRLQWAQYLQGRRNADFSEDDVLAWIVLEHLADEFEVLIPDQVLRQALLQFFGPDILDSQVYTQVYRNLGARSAPEFEATFRSFLRVGQTRALLQNGLVATTAEGLEAWRKEYEEFRLDFVAWTADEFADEAAVLVPTDEELQAYYDQLPQNERFQLEREQTLAFDAFLVTPEALQTEAVQAWLPAEEPSEEALQGFYDFHRFTRYRKENTVPGEDPFLTREEVGEQLRTDYLLQRAALLVKDRFLESDQSPEDFAAAMGVEYLRFEEPVPRTELPDLERVGSPDLQRLLNGEAGQWWDQTVFCLAGCAVVRPLEIPQRELPPLDEIRDSVADFWRRSRQGELAREAAEAFVAGLPRPEEYIEGDPLLLDGNTFATAAGASGRVVQVMDWAARTPRPTTDPLWDRDDKIRPWLQRSIGQRLGQAESDLLVNQVVEPLENAPEKAWVVARLAGRRLPDTEHLWPQEIQLARQLGWRNLDLEAAVSYAGLARAYDIRKTVALTGGGEGN